MDSRRLLMAMSLWCNLHLTRLPHVPRLLPYLLRSRLTGRQEVRMVIPRNLMKNDGILPHLRCRNQDEVDITVVYQGDSSSLRQFLMKLPRQNDRRMAMQTLPDASIVECSRVMPRIPTMPIAASIRLAKLLQLLVAIIEKTVEDLIFFQLWRIRQRKNLRPQVGRSHLPHHGKWVDEDLIHLRRCVQVRLLEATTECFRAMEDIQGRFHLLPL